MIFEYKDIAICEICSQKQNNGSNTTYVIPCEAHESSLEKDTGQGKQDGHVKKTSHFSGIELYFAMVSMTLFITLATDVNTLGFDMRPMFLYRY